MFKRRGPPSQGWHTFLQNHAADIAAMDLFVVRTINFKLLYGFVIVRLNRRDLVWVNVTPNPTAEWVVDGLDRQDEQAWRVLRQPARRVVLWRARYYSDECAVTGASQTDGVVRICRSPAPHPFMLGKGSGVGAARSNVRIDLTAGHSRE
jgi:hypothetical protein